MIEMIKNYKKFNKFHVSILRKIELKRVKKCDFLIFWAAIPPKIRFWSSPKYFFRILRLSFYKC